MTENLNENLRFNNKIVLIYFIFTTFNGALRKWVFSSESVNSLLLLFQMISPFLLFIFLKGISNKLTHSSITVIYGMMLIAMALNPLNATLMHGVLGFMLHFSFWLLIFLYFNNRDYFPVERLTKPFFIVSIIELSLAIIQFTLPPTHIINRYSTSSDLAVIAQVGDFVRVTGTFSYISGFGCFLFFAGCYVWGVFVGKTLSSLASYILVLLVIVCALMNGSRAIMVMVILFVILALSEMAFKQKMGVATISILTLFLIPFTSLDKKIPFVKDAYEAFYNRTTELNASGEYQQRVTGPYQEVMNFRGEYPLMGVGLGATYQGAIQKWGRSQYVQKYGYFEEEPERIVIEGGFTLFLMRFLLFGILLIKTHIPRLYLIPILGLLIFYIPMVFNVFLSAYSFLGIMYLDKIYYLKSLREPLEDNS